MLIGAGGTGAALNMMMCLALYNPDVSWDRKKNPALGTTWVLMNRFYPVYMAAANRRKMAPDV
ncbi:Cytochrome c oxidase subunit NDUFA4 [Lemmus lemmus]